MMSAPRRVSAATIIVAVAIAAAIGVIIWVFSVVRDEEPPLDPTPIPTEVVAGPGTPVSTPAATPDSGDGPIVATQDLVTVLPIQRGSIENMLEYSPDRLADDSLPLSDVAEYADIEAWMRARDVETPRGPDDPAFGAWEDELENLAIPSVLSARATDEVWIDTYGFGLHDVHQVLAVGQAPDYVLIMRGHFDPDELQAAWAESGYQAIRRQDVTLWSLFPGDAVDLSAPASRPSLGNMNNVVLLDDGTLIATSRLARLEQAIRAARGDEPSLDENPEISALLARPTFPQRIDTAVILKGSLLAADPGSPMVATPAPVVSRRVTDATTPVTMEGPPSLPQATMMLASMDAGSGDVEPRFSLVFSYPTADDAAAAMFRADRAIRTAESPVTGMPYADRIDLRSTRMWAIGEERTIVELRATLLAGTDDWQAIIEQRDLGFVMWPWEP
jgi:hypothetical protein